MISFKEAEVIEGAASEEVEDEEAADFPLTECRDLVGIREEEVVIKIIGETIVATIKTIIEVDTTTEADKIEDMSRMTLEIIIMIIEMVIVEVAAIGVGVTEEEEIVTNYKDLFIHLFFLLLFYLPVG